MCNYNKEIEEVTLKIVGLLFITAMSFGELQIPSMDIEENYNPLVRDEVDVIERLIHVNEVRLGKQKRLRRLMELFQTQKEAFAAGKQSQSHAFSMVSNARDILNEIKEEHLSYLFSPDYLEELVFFSSLAARNAPVRPEMSH